MNATLFEKNEMREYFFGYNFAYCHIENCVCILQNIIILVCSPPLDRLLEKFYSTIGGPFNLPVILSPPVLRKMRASFHDNHGSVVTFVQETKMALAHHFSTEGKNVHDIFCFVFELSFDPISSVSYINALSLEILSRVVSCSGPEQIIYQPFWTTCCMVLRSSNPERTTY